MINTLGGLNYDAFLSVEDYRSYRDLLEKEILNRFLLSSGYPPFNTALTGIVDIIDPTKISTSESTRPLLVSNSSIEPLKVKVNPGMVVTPSGALVKVSENYNLSLARTEDNDINIVFVENEIIESGTQTINDYMENLASQEIQNPDSLRCVLKSDWDDVSLFSPTRKSNIVVIAVVSVIPTSGGGQELQIDLTKNTFNFNRPWFSVVDIRHRSSIGTGTVTDSNPHGMSYNDLTTSGNVGLFQGLSDSGLIVSRDRHVSKMTGSVYCKETIPLSRIKIDAGGVVTANSKYTKNNARYCELLAFPTRLGSVYEQGKTGNSIAAELIEGTNILVFGPNESLANPLMVEYTDTSALMPPISAPTNLLSFGLPAEDEIIVSGGITYPSIADPTITLEGSGPFPRRYFVYQLGNGTLQAYPQIVVPATRLDLIGTNLYQVPKPLQNPSRIRLGLTKTDSVSGMSVTITLYGKDTNAAPISESITLSSASGYVDENTPSNNFDSPYQSVVTSKTFGSLDSIQVDSRSNDGPLSTIQLWAEIEPGSTPEINDALKIAEIRWNGQGISQILDCRKISKGFYKKSYDLTPVGQSLVDSARLISSITSSPLWSGSSSLLFTEDFEDLKYLDSFRGFASSIDAVGVITVQNNGLIAAGDTITLKPGKVLTFVSGDPLISAGQVSIGSSASETRTLLIETINDLGFDSGITASVGSGDNNINLVLSGGLGSIGNTYVISGNLSNSLSMSFSGFNFGYDPIGECYLDRSITGLKSYRIPPSSNLRPSGYEYRERYRSRAVAIPMPVSDYRNFIVEAHGEDVYYPNSVRIRGSTYGNPNSWSEWKIMSPLANGSDGIYKYLFDSPVHKIQIEYYGKARGLSAYQIK